MDSRTLRFEEALLSMDRLLCRSLLHEAMADDGGLAGIEKVVGPSLAHIGDRWEAGELALTQVYMGGRICEDLLGEFCPPEGPQSAGGPRIGVAVLLDHHQLGKRIVTSALRAGGFRVLDFGQGLDPGELARRVRREPVAILMVSVLMFNSALHIRELREALGEGPDRPRLVVGGAPFRFNPALWQEVGADAVGHTGVDAVHIAQRILEETCAQ
ncbi:MAG: cobalamin-dependent protein [Holophagaceae bacterium]|jgi:methanogenic corrinoid protein MtbC1|nr:cobalamin-dependent protein [Holophagaceae bacterium]